MKKTLITGADGFIGGHLVNELRINPNFLGPDIEIFLQVRSEASAENLRRDGWRVVVGDITDSELYTQLPGNLECVLHIAGLAGGPAADLEKANVRVTENLLRSMKIRHVPELVFMSTAAVYKESKSPIPEEGEISPSTEYGHSKYAAELLIRERVDAKALRSAVILRLNNIYGPGSDHGMIASFVKAVRKGEPVLLDGDGSQVREPVYVDDVVGAIKASLQKGGTGCTIYNISGSETMTIADLAKRIHAIAGKEIQILPSSKSPAPPRLLRLNILKARQELGWQPRVSLEDGLKRTYQMTNPKDLLAYGRNVTSEHGEDGVIEKIFEIIGEKDKWSVELGALNGIHGSNVWHLIKELGWFGVLIEADRMYFEKLQKEYAGLVRAHCVNAFVSFEGENSLDNIFARTPLPRTFDLFSLDIDGNEYHLWESLVEYRPRVMLVEFNPSIPNDVVFIQPRDMKIFQGSSLLAFIELGKRKGYELIATNETNAFFVLKELFDKFGIADNSIDALHIDHRYETKLFQLYDGTLCISGYDRLIWHNLPIDAEKLQIIPRRLRRYPAHIDEESGLRALKYWIRKSSLYPLLQRIRKLLK